RALRLKETLIKYITKSVEKSLWLGRQLGVQLVEGDIIALIGDLGGGKTWFTKGIAVGLGIEPNDVVSPTFTIVNEYYGKYPLFHIDLYRIENKEDFVSLDVDSYFLGHGVVVIEWADRWQGRLPDERVQIEFKIIDDSTRELTFYGLHDRPRAIIDALNQKIGTSVNNEGLLI
ncbi:MAG: tRNA (adenosine(37)-N6)-threonylcarbamoyltransferase complex ATPase subunit type 1 TsaE, partial [Deltaproteobacteria bacterium]|nr:tRNA (adenosine(37)-N6)-threonylcarbamoyltransferase complex ATPase subunit type 1 TsaE [Deltaproteobacteria bacterium]